MKFFSPKYPQFILGIFLCFTFFFAMPMSEVKAVEAEGICPPVPVAENGKMFAKIYVSNTGIVGPDSNNTPVGATCKYVKINDGSSTITYQDLLDNNIVQSAWAKKPTLKVWTNCDGTGQGKVLRDFFIQSDVNDLDQTSISLSTKDGCMWTSGNANMILNHFDSPNRRFGYFINLSEVVDGAGIYLFFMEIVQADQTKTEQLDTCKDKLATVQFEDKPCYTPNEQAESNDFFAITKTMSMACKLEFEKCMKGADTADPNASDPRYGTPPGYEGPLPDCAFSYDGCRSINDVLQFLVNIGQQVFKYIGTFAFVMFIYGGFTMILSMGSAEKVKKGQEILTAAVVGIIISFGAYLLIDFILDALQVGKDFRSIGALEQADEIPNPNAKKPNAQ